MITLKKQISRYMYMSTLMLIVVIVLSLMCIQLFTEQNRAYREATTPIQQLESLLYENQKDSISDIFASLRINPDTDYYAIDRETHKIIGSTDSNTVGLTADQIGITPSTIHKKPEGFHARVNNKWSFCVFKQTGAYYLGRIITAESLYQRVPSTVFWVSLGFVLLALSLAQSVIRYMNKYIVKNIEALNQKLNSVANGNENEIFDIGGSEEFTKLNQYITVMIKNLMDHSKKMSYALSKTNVHIGIYEYGSQLKKLQYTEYIPIIFSINELKMDYFSKHPTEFQAFLDNIRKNPINLEEEIYQYKDRFIRLEEMEDDGEIFGIAMDVTHQTLEIMKIEQERDIDTLTDLYNRRGLDNQLEQLFSKPDKLGYSALFMIDGDGLKGINDTYGHDKGDIYLKKIGETIAAVGTKGNLSSRQGGDEFVLFLYGYETEEELMTDIRIVDSIRDNTMVELDKDIEIPLRFSLGYSLIDDNTDYQALLKRADEKMYQNKLERKKQ